MPDQKKPTPTISEAQVRDSQAAYAERMGRLGKAVKDIMGATPFALVVLIDPKDVDRGVMTCGNVPPEIQNVLFTSAIVSRTRNKQSVTLGQLYSHETGKALGGVDVVTGQRIETKNKA